MIAVLPSSFFSPILSAGVLQMLAGRAFRFED